MYNLEQLRADMKEDILYRAEQEYGAGIALDVRQMLKHTPALMSIDPENNFEDALVTSLNQVSYDAMTFGKNYGRDHVENIREACEQTQDKFVRIAVADFLKDKGYTEAKIDLIEAMTTEKTNYDEKSLSDVFEQALDDLNLNEKTCGTKEKDNKEITRD